MLLTISCNPRFTVLPSTTTLAQKLLKIDSPVMDDLSIDIEGLNDEAIIVKKQNQNRRLIHNTKV
jgi:hypothetical protein